MKCKDKISTYIGMQHTKTLYIGDKSNRNTYNNNSHAKQKTITLSKHQDKNI